MVVLLPTSRACSVGEPTPARGAGARSRRRAPVTSAPCSTSEPALSPWSSPTSLGIFVFAISGALVAVRREMDVFGVLVLAGTTGLGGGFLRDVLIGATPPAALVGLALPAGAGRGRAADLLVPPGGRPAGAHRDGLRRLRARAVLRHRRAQGAGLRPRPAAGGADGHGRRHRRRDGPRRAGPPGAGGVPRGALRHPGPRRRRAGGRRQPARPAHAAGGPRRAPASARSGGCWRCGGAGRRRSRAGRPASRPSRRRWAGWRSAGRSSLSRPVCASVRRSASATGCGEGLARRVAGGLCVRLRARWRRHASFHAPGARRSPCPVRVLLASWSSTGGRTYRRWRTASWFPRRSAAGLGWLCAATHPGVAP